MKGIYVPDTVVITEDQEMDWFYTNNNNLIQKHPYLNCNIINIQNFFIKRDQTPSMFDENSSQLLAHNTMKQFQDSLVSTFIQEGKKKFLITTEGLNKALENPKKG